LGLGFVYQLVGLVFSGALIAICALVALDVDVVITVVVSVSVSTTIIAVIVWIWTWAWTLFAEIKRVSLFYEFVKQWGLIIFLFNSSFKSGFF
jgi:hypothetical protein